MEELPLLRTPEAPLAYMALLYAEPVAEIAPRFSKAVKAIEGLMREAWTASPPQSSLPFNLHVAVGNWENMGRVPVLFRDLF